MFANALSRLTKVAFKVPETASHTREMWQFHDADWDMLASEIAEADWSFLQSTQPSQAAHMMTEKLLHMAKESIPKKMVTVKKSTHSWLLSECKEAVARLCSLLRQ
jgi:hypothetical protein